MRALQQAGVLIMPGILIDSIFLRYATFLLNSTSQICVCVCFIHIYICIKLLSKAVDFVLPQAYSSCWLIFYLFVLFGSFVLRLEADGTTGEGVVAVKGFLSSEPWVRWGNAGRARLLPAPFPQCAQWGRAPVPAPVWLLMSTLAEEASHLGDTKSFSKCAQNGRGGRTKHGRGVQTLFLLRSLREPG